MLIDCLFASRFMYRGRLVGHNGAVSALTMKGNIMASGARDRLIKVCCVCVRVFETGSLKYVVFVRVFIYAPLCPLSLSLAV